MPRIYIPKNKIRAVRKLLDGYRLAHSYKLVKRHPTKRRKSRRWSWAARNPQAIFNNFKF